MHALDSETLLLAMAITQDNHKKREISMYLLELRKVKPYLTGKDLKAMGIIPGPVFSKILNVLLEGRLRGSLITREDEIEEVKRVQGGEVKMIGLR